MPQEFSLQPAQLRIQGESGLFEGVEKSLRRSLWNLMVRTYVKPQPGLPPPLENLLPPGSLL